MLVKNWMTRDVITVDAEDSMLNAVNIMKEHKIRMLPVMFKGRPVGVVSDTDLKRASASDATSLDVHELIYLVSRIKVKEIMTKDPIFVVQDYTIEETAALLRDKKISGVPVVDEKGGLVGIITRDDLFKVLTSLTGLSKRGIQFAFRIADRSGSIKELTDIVRNYNGRIAAILSSYERAPEGFRNVYIRVYDIDREKLAPLQAELKAKAAMLYMVDYRENTRVVYE